MIRPIHESDHIVGPDGVLSLRSLSPGSHVRVIVVETPPGDSPQWGPGLSMGTRVFRPEQPRLAWGTMSSTVQQYDQPFEPACDPEDWEALG